MPSTTLDSPAQSSHCDTAHQLVSHISEAIQHCRDLSEMLVYLGLLVADQEAIVRCAHVSGFVEAKQISDVDPDVELVCYDSPPDSLLVADLLRAAHALGVARGLRLGRGIVSKGVHQ